MSLRNLFSCASRFSCYRRLSFFSSFSTSNFDQALFDEACKKVQAIEVGDDVKLQLYGLFKQATVGDTTGARPSITNFVGRAKFDSWKSNAGLSIEEAKLKYCEIVNSYLTEDDSGRSFPVSESSPTGESTTAMPGLKIQSKGKILWIELSRPEKYNALTWEMYRGIINTLDQSNEESSISLTVLTGAGDYYSSGNDLSNFTDGLKSADDLKRMANNGESVLEQFVRAFIDYKKPLIALVNGPAVGIVVSTLALFDFVLASDKATFHTPFTALGQSPEGCSSYTFPLLMGPLKASEILLFGKKLTADEALDRNLVNRVLPYHSFRVESERYVNRFAELPPESLRLNKQLLRSVHRERLLEVNVGECKFLKERWLSAECRDAIQKFVTRRK